MRYLLHQPPAREAAQEPWPVIVFLHGASETGDNLDWVKRHGPPKLVQERPEFPFLVVAPQSTFGGWDPRALDQILDQVLASQPADEQRVYLTGISIGGFGTWAWGAARPERFAALAPICGGGDPATAIRLKDMPIWAFHGALDRIVPPIYTEVMVEALRKIGSDVRYTLYPDADHDAWTQTYENHELYEWFLQHRRPTTTQAG